MKKWLGIFIINEYLCSQVIAGVHRTYSMFVEILEKSPNFEDRGGECSPPLLYQNLYLSSYDEVIIVYLFRILLDLERHMSNPLAEYSYI